MRARLAAIVGVVALAGVSFGAQQLVPTKTFLVKNPPSGSRKVLLKVKDTAATVVGDPTADGAALRIVLTPGGDQCVTMPASGWSAISTIGFKYKDAALANGPVKVALIKKTPSGTFLLKALLKNGGPTSIAVTPGDPTTTYGTNFTLGTGDEYCGGTATAAPKPDDAVTFKVSNDGAPAGCVATCNATTVSSSTTSSTETTTSTSTTTPSFHFIFVTSALYDGALGGLAGADRECQTLATAAALPGTYRAFLSGTGLNAADRIGDFELRLTDGVTVVANNKTDFLDGALDAAISKDQTGAVVEPRRVWTATQADGTSFGQNCNNAASPGDWSTTSARTLTGFSSSTDSGWASGGSIWPCASVLSLYCFQQ